MKCVNHDRCGNHVDFGHPMTYWEATVAVRDRDGGGPNRRSLKRTGRGWCVPCSTRIEHHLEPDHGQQLLIDA